MDGIYGDKTTFQPEKALKGRMILRNKQTPFTGFKEEKETTQSARYYYT